MAVTAKDILDQIKEKDVKYVDVRFTDIRGKMQHVTFDIDLARSQSNDNPVFYVQYAHARVCSLLRQAGEKGYAFDADNGQASLHRLDDAPADMHVGTCGHISSLVARIAAMAPARETETRALRPA